MDIFHQANREESLKGNIVLTVELAFYDGATDPQRANPGQKQLFDELHLRKIELADEVLVLDVGGYIGQSTAKEVAHAKKLGKKLRYWTTEHPNA